MSSTKLHGGQTWRNIENPGHIFNTSCTNEVTLMTHLFDTKETKRAVNINSPSYKKYPQFPKRCCAHVKRTGKAISVFCSINEILYMFMLPAFDPYLRNPDTGRLKEVLVSVVDNGFEMPKSSLLKTMLVWVRRLLSLEQSVQEPFAEY